MKWQYYLIIFLIFFLSARFEIVCIDEEFLLRPSLSLILEGNLDVDEYDRIPSFELNGHRYTGYSNGLLGLFYVPFYLLGENIVVMTGLKGGTNFVVSGFESTCGGGLTLTVASGTTVIGGKLIRKASPTSVLLVENATNYVRIKNNGIFNVNTSYTLGSDEAGIAIVITSAGNIQRIHDWRLLTPERVVGFLNCSDPLVQYSGIWDLEIDSSYMGGCRKYSEKINGYVDFVFQGNTIRWYSYYSPSHGIAEVFLDGRSEGIVDTYSQTHVKNVLAYTKTELSEGVHTIRIKVTGTKHENSTWHWINIEGFAVDGHVNSLHRENIPLRINTFSHIATAIPTIISTIIAIIYIQKILTYFGVKRNISQFMAYFYAFGTIIFFYTPTMWSAHIIPPTFLMIIFHDLATHQSYSSCRSLLLGLSIAFTCTMFDAIIPVSLVFLLYAIFKFKSYKNSLPLIFGFSTYPIFLLLFNYYFTGNPFLTLRQAAFLGGWGGLLEPYLSYPRLEVLFAHFFSAKASFMIFSPLLLLPIILLWKFNWKILNAESTLFLSVFVNIFSISFLNSWLGAVAWGNRYASESIFQLTILAGLLLDRRMKSFFAHIFVSLLFIWSCFLNGLGTLSETWLFYSHIDKSMYGSFIQSVWPMDRFPYTLWIYRVWLFFTGGSPAQSWPMTLISATWMNYPFLIATLFLTTFLGLRFLWKN